VCVKVQLSVSQSLCQPDSVCVCGLMETGVTGSGVKVSYRAACSGRSFISSTPFALELIFEPFQSCDLIFVLFAYPQFRSLPTMALYLYNPLSPGKSPRNPTISPCYVCAKLLM